MSTSFINGIQLKDSTIASLRRVAKANLQPGETVGKALRRLCKKAEPAVHKQTGEVVFAGGEGTIFHQKGCSLYTWSDGWPFNTGWYTLRKMEGHQPKTSATPGCAYGAYHYW